MIEINTEIFTNELPNNDKPDPVALPSSPIVNHALYTKDHSSNVVLIILVATFLLALVLGSIVLLMTNTKSKCSLLFILIFLSNRYFEKSLKGQK